MSSVQTTAGDVDVDLSSLFATLLRNWLRILLAAVAVSILAFVLASLATPRYSAETRVLIESRESVFTRPQGEGADDRPMMDEEGVTSQVEIIASTDILKKVARELNLASLPEFDEAAGLSSVGNLMVLFGLKSDPQEIPAEERVLKAFREKLSVYRIERSRVIVISFSSRDPKLAAEVPNAIADAYLEFGREAKRQSGSDATGWLEPEIATLTQKVKDAEAKVAQFRAESDLALGSNNAALSTQQLSELSTELSRVRANRAAAEANSERVRRAVAAGGSLESFPEILSSGLIQRLREREVQLKADIADLSTTLLDNHPRLRGLRSQLADLEGQIRSEAQTILAGLANEAQAARAREEQLVADLNRLKVESSRVGEKEVELRALEREAAAQRDLLESYLVRFRAAASRQDGNYVPADARIFSRAVAPLEPYFPKVMPIVGAAFAGTILLLSVALLLRELFSGRAMRPAQRDWNRLVQQVRMPMPPAVAASKAAEAYERDPNVAGLDPAEAARQIVASGAQRILCLSPGGDEAAASAVLMTRQLADDGLRTILVDLTASGAASRPMRDGDMLVGITDLLAAQAQFSEAIHSDLYSEAHVIPSGTADPVKAMRAADRLPIVLDSLGSAYDMVIVECGPARGANLARLVGEGTEIVISMIEGEGDVELIREDLANNGFTAFAVVTPVADEEPPTVPSTSRAA